MVHREWAEPGGRRGRLRFLNKAGRTIGVRIIIETTFDDEEREAMEAFDKALERGMPYQSLLASIVHQYAEGALVEKK